MAAFGRSLRQAPQDIRRAALDRPGLRRRLDPLRRARRKERIKLIVDGGDRLAASRIALSSRAPLQLAVATRGFMERSQDTLQPHRGIPCAREGLFWVPPP